MEEKLNHAMKEFSILSQQQKQQHIIQWVKKGSKAVLPILKRISTEDPEARIRFLARKGLFHLRKRLRATELALPADVEFSKLRDILNMGIAQKSARVVEFCIRNQRKELLEYIQKHFTEEKDPFMLSSFLVGIGRLGGKNELELVKSALEHGDSRVRASAVEAMGNLGLKECNPYLLKALSDTDNRIRANAIRALKSKAKERVFDSLREMVNSEHVWMRNSAAFAIGEYRSEEVLDLLVKLLTDENPSVKKKAYQALEQLTEHGLVKANLLKSRLADFQGEESVADFMKLLDEEVIQEITKAAEEQPAGLYSEDSGERLKAINKILKEEDKERYRQLEERLVVEEDNYVKATLILALGRTSQESAVPLMKSFLNHPIPRIRANSIEALASFNKPEYLTEVLLRLDDANNRARANAIIALKKMPYVNVMEPLRQMACSKDVKDKHSAFYVISEFATQEAAELFLLLAQEPNDNQLLNNIREFLLMHEKDGDWVESIKQKLGDRIDFTKLDIQFEEDSEDDEDEEEILAESDITLSEQDFEGFMPDNARPVEIESVNWEIFMKSAPEKKVQMIDFMKQNLSQEHFTILRYAEQDNDFQVKCLAKIALNSYKDKNFKVEELESSSETKSNSYFIPELKLDRMQLEYEGVDSIAVLDKELQKRSESFREQGFWEGKFGIRRKLLCALRQDTQEMLQQILDAEQYDVQSVGICFYSPTMKPFLDGLKSLDGLNYENFIQLNTEKARLQEHENDDYISDMVREFASPKYLLVLATKSRLILFLRSMLQYSHAEVVQIPYSKIVDIRVEKDVHMNHLVVELQDKILLMLPKMFLKNAVELMTTVKEMKQGD
jgi:HEAT repeat protein